ncbi:hypothetical protein Vadar_028331 [Vaccinium darrowii]|uniref:Uncharacterized protein n=1 Tax=Vaccinium darrowii TaxID=229202 RepID=A0ACB7Y2C0_9ERIC|nr:hypothetical protein Vadar_028331 [Vaccinium darrowii]
MNLRDQIKLRSKIPWLFKKKKNWSNRIGQFDLLGFWVKDVQADQKLSRRILGGLLKIINCKDEFDSVFNEESEFLKILGFDCVNTPRGIICIHIITEICYYLANVASEAPGFDEQNRKTTRTLSHYMMYLLAIHPSSLSADKVVLDGILSSIYGEYRINEGDIRDVRAVCERIFTVEFYNLMNQGLFYLMRKPKAERWKILEFVWMRMLCHAAIKCQKDIHLQHMRKGGELLTLLWLFLPQCGGLGSLELDDPRILGLEFNRSFPPDWMSRARTEVTHSI